MDHPLFCNLCRDRASKGGLTRVRNMLVFTFCGKCNREQRSECDALMDRCAGPAVETKQQRRRAA